MKRVLLIKLTSLGDLIHALPALTDAQRACPDIKFDWLIDDNFQEIARWHGAVGKVFTTNHRAWRHALKNIKTYLSIYNLVSSLRKEQYDLIIDGQGNFKTASLAFCLKAKKAGFDKYSVREKIASFAYNTTFNIPKHMHAIERLRRLFADSLDYRLPLSSPDFSIDCEKFRKPLFELPPSYLVFVHNASWKTKLWPEEHWICLIKKCVQRGETILLPWGNLEEKARAERLAISQQTIVLPKLSLCELGFVLLHAKSCVCVDTGLSHLAAALNVPSITLYGSTDAGLIGASGSCQHHLQAHLECAPCNQKKCAFPIQNLTPPCLASHHPELVFSLLEKIVK